MKIAAFSGYTIGTQDFDVQNDVELTSPTQKKSRSITPVDDPAEKASE